MSKPLFAPVPGFDQPIAVLKHCHDRIRKQIRTMQGLLAHLPQHGADAEARQAAASVRRYFNQAAPNHHADEEQDLLPMLRATAGGDDAGILHELLPQIMAEHVEMEAAWDNLDRQLQMIEAGESASLSTEDVARFAALYGAHMEKEESFIAPMAKRIFTADQMALLGNAMRARRGVPNQGE